MRRLLLITLFISIPIALLAQGYEPRANGQIVRHNYYSLSYIEEHEQAEWVYYSLVPAMMSGVAKRRDDFRADPKVKSGSAELSDYRGSGYDRGHICPAADMSFSTTAMSESFFLSNMSPQHPSFNRGRWKSLEEAVRGWAFKTDTLYVVSGPIFSDNIETIGKGVTVPGYYYKAIYSPRKGQMIGFVMPNRKISEPLSDFVCSVDWVEELTGLDLFHQLPDSIERRLESETNITHWPL